MLAVEVPFMTDEKLASSILPVGRQVHGFFFVPPLIDNYWGHIFEELYKSRIYDRFLPLRREKTVALDIGANVGLVSYYLSLHFEKVISLEPSIEHFNLLQKMLEFNQITNVKPIQKALYIEEGQFPFFHNQNKTMYSLHMAVQDQKLLTEIVSAITLDKLFEQEKIDHVNLMKIDVEGSEVEILSSLGFKNVAEKIDTILVERHQWSGRHPNQLNEALKNAGFNIETIPNSADLVVAKRK